jgi:hypothetical protein
VKAKDAAASKGALLRGCCCEGEALLLLLPVLLLLRRALLCAARVPRGIVRSRRGGGQPTAVWRSRGVAAWRSGVLPQALLLYGRGAFAR